MLFLDQIEGSQDGEQFFSAGPLWCVLRDMTQYPDPYTFLLLLGGTWFARSGEGFGEGNSLGKELVFSTNGVCSIRWVACPSLADTSGC